MKAITLWSAISAILQVGASSSCYYPGRPQNTIMYELQQVNDIGKYKTGDKVTYQCDPGYESLIKAERFCLQDGTWNGTKPVCAKNIASDASRLEASVKDVKKIVDGNDRTCEKLSSDTGRFVYYWFQFPQAFNLNSVKSVFEVGAGYKGKFSVYFNDSLTLERKLLFSTSYGSDTTKMNDKIIYTAFGLRKKSTFVSTKEVSIQLDKYNVSYEVAMCEVSIYSNTESKPKMCEDLTLFPLEQFKTVYYDHRCFYVSHNGFTHQTAAAHICLYKRAEMATIDSGRLNYLSTFISGFSKTPFTYWVSNQTFVNNQDTSNCGMACCTALTEKITETLPVNCDIRYGYICEKELEKCGTPDQNKITLIKNRTGKKVSYVCPEGFRLKGDKDRYCRGGEWTGKAPVCEGEEIGKCSLPVFEGGKAVLLDNNTNVGSWIQIECNFGKFLPPNVSDLRRCEPGGKWSGNFTECVVSSELPFTLEEDLFSSEGDDDTSTAEIIKEVAVEVGLFLVISNAVIWLSVWAIIYKFEL